MKEDSACGVRDAWDVTAIAAVMFWESLDTPRALGLALRLQHGLLSELVMSKIDPSDYLDAASFAVDYAAVKYLSKIKHDIANIDREGKALQSFREAESRCRSTNIRLVYARPLKGLETILHRAREKIARILNDCDVDQIVSLSRFGPGATATVKGAEVRPEAKISERRLSVTRGMLGFAQCVVGRDLHWCRARGIDAYGPCTLLPTEFQIVEHMRVVTVPKDAKIDRTIGAEPTFNTWIQAGIGRLIRKRLRSAGVNLDDQSINQTWAQLALPLDLATVDLSQASDSVCYWLVEELLPRKWFRLLDAARSGYARLPGGKTVALEKFSSMGNGYTFELETLIFYALSIAVCEEGEHGTSCISVYGDDIIVPAPAYNRLVDVFQRCGFVINTDKSYADGYFYESCGKHYFNGVDVTPIYQKEVLTDISETVRAHNRIFRWYLNIKPHRTIDLRRTISYLRKARSHEKRIPAIPWDMEGDAGFLTPDLEVPYSDKGILLSVLVALPKRVVSINDGALLAITFTQSRSADRLHYLAPVDMFFDSGPLGGSHECKVPIRGDDGYKIAWRWIPLRREAVLWTDVARRRTWAYVK